MPWNEPGSGGGKDPWGQNRGPQQGPPDLDEIVKTLQNKLGGLFGGRGRGGGGSGSGAGRQMPGKPVIVLVLLVLFGAWIFSGFYVVEQGEAGVVLQFGRYKETKTAGLRWHVPAPIETVEIVNVQKVNTVEVGYRSNQRTRQTTTVPREALRLTADENIIDIHFAVQYDIKDPRDRLFFMAEDPEQVVRQSTESAVREIVGRNTMDFAITEGRAEIAQQTKELLQQILDRYRTGINVRAVEMQNAQPPAEVKAAFDDAVKAREDEERLKNEAEAYANDVIPRARGAAARIVQEAEAYKASVIARAEGEASRFTQVLGEYEKAPAITRDRLYLESMEQVMTSASKLVIDQQDGNNVIYLPLDQLMRQRQATAAAASGAAQGFAEQPSDLAAGTTRRGRSTARSGRTQ